MFERLGANLDIWFFLLGLPAQLAFFSRFLVQWIVSERRGASVVPLAFWYLSVSGGLALLIYGIIRAEPVLIIGNLMGSIVYVRNLMLIHRKKQVAA